MKKGILSLAFTAFVCSLMAQSLQVKSLGGSPNPYSVAFGQRTFLWADPTINTIILTHRSNVNGSDIMYDISKDGGNSWQSNQGPAYTSQGANGSAFPPARFPQGVIYNPSGNTDPNQAYFVYCGVGSRKSNGGDFGSHVYGVNKLDGTGATQKEVNSPDIGMNLFIPDEFTITQQGVAFALDPDVAVPEPSVGGIDKENYTDKIVLSKGTFNSSSNDFDYTQTLVNAPMSMKPNGKKAFERADLAFAPDGQTGYITVAGHDSYTQFPDSNVYFMVYKTTDGGSTWSKSSDINVTSIAQAAGGQGTVYSAYKDHDVVVDVNGNPHIIAQIGSHLGAFTVSPFAGSVAVFHIFSEDKGATWKSQTIGVPQTIFGCFGDCPGGTLRNTEGNRIQASVSYDGTKVFMTYFDTDTTLFGTPEKYNNSPDAICIGYDVTTKLYTPLRNMTNGATSPAFGILTYGMVSHYVLDKKGVYTIPIAFGLLTDPNDVTKPIQYNYLQGVSFSNSDFTQQSVAVEDAFTGERNTVAVQNFPNPATETTNFLVELRQSANVRVKIYNTVGQEVLANGFGQFGKGLHTLNMNISSLKSGVYFYTVDTGAEKATGRLIVK